MKNQGWIAFDQWLNAALFKGWADETISARAYRNSLKGIRKWVLFHKWINILFFWEKDHCYWAYVMEANRMQMPVTYRALYGRGSAE